MFFLEPFKVLFMLVTKKIYTPSNAIYRRVVITFCSPKEED